MSRRLLVFGFNESPWLGEGWHEREAWGRGGTCRLTAGRAQIRLPADQSGQAWALLMSAPMAAARGQDVTVTVSVDATVMTRETLPGDLWRLVRGRLPENLGPEALLTIETTPVLWPHKRLGSGDHREIGVKVAALRLGADEATGDFDSGTPS